VIKIIDSAYCYYCKGKLKGKMVTYHPKCYDYIFSESYSEISNIIGILRENRRFLIKGNNFYNNLYLGLKLSDILFQYLTINFDLTNTNIYNNLFLITNYNFFHEILIRDFLEICQYNSLPCFLIVIDSGGLSNPKFIREIGMNSIYVFNDISHLRNKIKFSFDFKDKLYSIKLREIDHNRYDYFIENSDYIPFALL
jgi:hypothetical protein